MNHAGLSHFPRFVIPKSLMLENSRTRPLEGWGIMDSINKVMKEIISTLGRELKCYFSCFPSPQGSGHSLPVDKTVRDKIKELVVEHGVIRVSEMRTHIKLFVQQNYPNVSTENRSYYPFNTDLCRHILYARKRADIFYKKRQNPARRIRTKQCQKKDSGWHHRSCAETQLSKQQHSY